MRRITTALAALVLLGAAAHAQTLPPPAAPEAAPAAPAPGAPSPSPLPATPATPESRQEAAQLTEMIGVNRQSQQLVAVMRAQMVQMVVRTSGKTPEESAKIVDEVLMPDFTAQENELTNAIIEVWATNFSVEDLKALRAFYATPLGQRLIATLPTITREGMAAGQAWGRRIYQTAIQKHKDELIARGLKF
jgi:hypothetical protein